MTIAVSPLQQFTVKFALPSSFRPLNGQPSEELDSSSEELLFLPLTELELFCESSPDFTKLEEFFSATEELEPSSSLLLDEISPTKSGAELLDSSLHATKIQSAANKTPTEILLPIRGSCPLRQQVAKWSKRLHFVAPLSG